MKTGLQSRPIISGVVGLFQYYPPEGSINMSGKIKTRLRFIIGVTGAALLIGGILQGEYAVTLNKAVHICLECIGIG